jgi:hypothetical protein
MGLVHEHSIITAMTVELLGKCIQDAINGREEDLQKNFRLLEQKEH